MHGRGERRHYITIADVRDPQRDMSKAFLAIHDEDALLVRL